MKDFRTISLCNVVYKLIAKVFAYRFETVLNKLISPTQSTFVSGRLIIDNAMIEFEYIHTINNKQMRTEGIVAMKLDMSKAYDGVE